MGIFNFDFCKREFLLIISFKRVEIGNGNF